MPGTCSGCKKTSASCREMDKHVTTCPKYRELFRSDPSLALSPKAQYEKDKAYAASDEGADEIADTKDAARSLRIANLRANDKARGERHASSFGKTNAIALSSLFPPDHPIMDPSNITLLVPSNTLTDA